MTKTLYLKLLFYNLTIYFLKIIFKMIEMLVKNLDFSNLVALTFSNENIRIVNEEKK